MDVEIRGLKSWTSCWIHWMEWYDYCDNCRTIYDLMMAGF